ncbi:MAG TPA: hypothetical protein VMY98_04030 [Anaerolineae bacterium]|nr:hypothetical protein [Anaerolineae bacterium]
MERYSKDRPCPKCGCGSLSGTGIVRTQHEDVWVHEEGKSWVVGKMKEMMKRTCLNCGYNWYELPLDTKDA